MLRRYTWQYEKLLESFSQRYQLDTSGSLSDAVIKVAEHILNNEPNDDIKSWAESLVTTTKSDVFRNWYRNQKLQRPEKIIDRAGR